MWPKLKIRLHQILWRSDMMATTFTLALGSLAWALLLWWPGELFTPARITYRLMAEVTDENLWGAAFFFQGGTLLYLTLTNCKNRLLWVVDGIFGCALWTAATIACFLSHFISFETYQPPAAMSAEIALMLVSWWHLVRLNPIRLLGAKK